MSEETEKQMGMPKRAVLGLTREVGDILLIRGHLSKDLKEVREQPQGDLGYGNGGWLCSRRRDCRVPVGEEVCKGRIQRGGPCVWSEGESHGGEAGRQAGEGVTGPGGHWRVCSLELMTDRRCKATLQLVFPRDFVGGGVDSVAGRPVLRWLW